MKKLKKILAFFSACLLLMTSCTPAVPADTTGEEPVTEEKPRVEDLFFVIGKEEYADKTKSAFLAQLVGFLSGHEFAKVSATRCRVAMPDSAFKICRGAYAGNNVMVKHTNKLIKNAETGLWEVWNDDDFSVDIVNQYVLRNMYKNHGTLAPYYITKGWVDYDVYDMGGGQRQVGAYAMYSQNNQLPQFGGNGEYGNRYSFVTEPYLGADTLGLNAAGMPYVAYELGRIFGEATGDRDNVLWSQMFTVMFSLAYFESDIPTLIRRAAGVFPKGSLQEAIVEEVFELHKTYPDNWRNAYKIFESRHYHGERTRQTNNTINCGFVLLDLLYGNGDYLETCKIGSLAGYDCESTCGIALSVVAIINGTKDLPEEVNTYVWQDGQGVIVNLPISDSGDTGTYMYAAKLPERLKITDLLALYQQNFETVLAANGGYEEDGKYYIPKTEFLPVDSVRIENADFEDGDLKAYAVEGDVKISEFSTSGKYAVQMKGNGSISQQVTGLTVGATYRLTAFLYATNPSTARLFADCGDGEKSATVYSTISQAKNYDEQRTVRRSLYFTATAETATVGVRYETESAATEAILDDLSLVRTEERSAGTVTVSNLTSPVGSSVRVTVTAEEAGLAWLKWKFDNHGAIGKAEMTVNRKTSGVACFYRTSPLNVSTENFRDDYVYLPVPLKKGENTVSLTFSASKIFLDAEPEILFVSDAHTDA